jgi:alpha-amylase/alpha-mannosidase (GH57 family)
MHLAFVWHFHQPIYRDPETGEYLLPWVNYHAVKNYHQMARLAEEEEFPGTYNFVPCLLEQILEYAAGSANDPTQAALEKDPDRLTYADILLLRRIVAGETNTRRLQELAVKALFSPLLTPELDKDGLLHHRNEVLADLLPRYRRLREAGLAELTTSPYYHPLLPLIFDLRSARGESLPARTFRHPEDGIAQLLKGRAYFEKIFGFSPAGLWPSEGGVSRDVVRAAAEAGFLFALTDENILWKSKTGPRAPGDLFKPYRSGELSLFFRDQELSDLLSFEYQKCPVDEAVEDLVKRLEARRKSADEASICVIVLDGENPWEHYPDNGVPFLRSLYDRIKRHAGFTLTSLESYLAKKPVSPEIEIVPGTWLGNFSKWVGHPAKNAAWDRLSKAREACGSSEAMAIAEGSDWFWWYGEEGKDEFDYLFKAYIRKACRDAGKKEPE